MAHNEEKDKLCMSTPHDTTSLYTAVGFIQGKMETMEQAAVEIRDNFRIMQEKLHNLINITGSIAEKQQKNEERIALIEQNLADNKKKTKIFYGKLQNVH